MTTLAVVTTFPPNRWTAYAKRMLESHIQFWPDNVTLYAYHESDKPKFEHEKIKFVNIEEANPELVKFKQRHKNDPVANGEVTIIIFVCTYFWCKPICKCVYIVFYLV